MVGLLMNISVAIDVSKYHWLRLHVICAPLGPIKFFHRVSKKAFTIAYKVKRIRPVCKNKVTITRKLIPSNLHCSDRVARVEGVQGDFFQIYLFHRLVQGAF